MYFANIEPLADLENQGQWEKARELLYDTWKRDKSDCKNLVRLLAECWYIMTDYDIGRITDADISYETVKNTLIECVEFGMENFMENSQFLCIAGYMITQFPYFFYRNKPFRNDDALYGKWERIGADMRRKANDAIPPDKLAKFLHLGHIGDSLGYDEAREVYRDEILDLLPGKTEVEIYFRHILLTPIVWE